MLNGKSPQLFSDEVWATIAELYEKNAHRLLLDHCYYQTKWHLARILDKQ